MVFKNCGDVNVINLLIYYFENNAYLDESRDFN